MPRQPRTLEHRAAHSREEKARYQRQRIRILAVNKAWAKNNPEKSAACKRRHQLRSIYGMTPATWETLFDSQGRRCAICRSTTPKAKKGWHTDHVHGTKIVRGILCQTCNHGLGKLGDNIEGLQRALDYLRKSVQ